MGDDFFAFWKYDGFKPEEFYYKIDAGGKKKFYRLQDDKTTNKDRIPPAIINDVKMFDHNVEKALEIKDYAEQRKNCMEKEKEITSTCNNLKNQMLEFGDLNFKKILDDYSSRKGGGGSYYFKYDKSMNKIYYSKDSNKRVKISDIPENVREGVKMLDDQVVKANLAKELFDKITATEKLLLATSEKIKYINSMLEKADWLNSNYKSIIADYDKHKKIILEASVKKTEQAKQNLYENIFKHNTTTQPPPPPKRYKETPPENFDKEESKPRKPSTEEEIAECKAILKKFKIETKLEWKKWMLENHPDKVNDSSQEILKLVINAGRVVFDPN